MSDELLELLWVLEAMGVGGRTAMIARAPGVQFSPVWLHETYGPIQTLDHLSAPLSRDSDERRVRGLVCLRCGDDVRGGDADADGRRTFESPARAGSVRRARVAGHRRGDRGGSGFCLGRRADHRARAPGLSIRARWNHGLRRYGRYPRHDVTRAGPARGIAVSPPAASESGVCGHGLGARPMDPDPQGRLAAGSLRCRRRRGQLGLCIAVLRRSSARHRPPDPFTRLARHDPSLVLFHAVAPQPAALVLDRGLDRGARLRARRARTDSRCHPVQALETVRPEQVHTLPRLDALALLHGDPVRPLRPDLGIQRIDVDGAVRLDHRPRAGDSRRRTAGGGPSRWTPTRQPTTNAGGKFSGGRASRRSNTCAFTAIPTSSGATRPNARWASASV